MILGIFQLSLMIQLVCVCVCMRSGVMAHIQCICASVLVGEWTHVSEKELFRCHPRYFALIDRGVNARLLQNQTKSKLAQLSQYFFNQL